MSATFVQLNQGWNAEPNAPCPDVIVQVRDVLLTFFVNAFQFEHFAPDERGVLRFVYQSGIRFRRVVQVFIGL